MTNSSEPIQDVIDKEVEIREKVLGQLHEQIYKRVNEIKLLPGDTIMRIKKFNKLVDDLRRKK